MGNFAENLNLGNRFWPPPCQLFLLEYGVCMGWEINRVFGSQTY